MLDDTTSVDTVSETQRTVFKFHIFGHNISHSLSPALHNAGFQTTGFPGHYRISESEHADTSVERHIRDANFGGASVTFPHKLEVQQFVDQISEQARLIGAINTIVVRNTPNGRVVEGENTDWSGIKSCIERAKIEDLQHSSAVIFGAGGAARAACYAVQSLCIGEIVIVNRTQQTAKAMAHNFSAVRSQVCQTLEEASSLASFPIRVIVGCVPADDFGRDQIPQSLFTNSHEGVLVEMAYRPLVTGMMQVADSHPGWKVFKGMDVLQEQAFAQFELWTGCEAPKEVMVEAMNEELKRRENGADKR